MMAAIVILLLALVIIWLLYNPRVSIYSSARLKTRQKLLALTFDDGPEPIRTDQILKLLKRHHVKATFFVVGKNAKSYPELLKRIYAEGHQIANHSYGHNRAMPWSASQTLKELKATDEAIYDAIDKQPVFYRPPYGFRTPWSARAITAAGYKIVTWDNMTRDYFRQSSKSIVRAIVSKAKPGGIIVLHDGHEGMGSKISHVVEALPDIIDKLQAHGYSFVRLDDLFDTSGYRDVK